MRNTDVFVTHHQRSDITSISAIAAPAHRGRTMLDTVAVFHCHARQARRSFVDVDFPRRMDHVAEVHAVRVFESELDDVAFRIVGDADQRTRLMIRTPRVTLTMAMVNTALAREESMRYCDDRTESLEGERDDENGYSLLSFNERRKNATFYGGAL